VMVIFAILTYGSGDASYCILLHIFAVFLVMFGGDDYILGRIKSTKVVQKSTIFDVFMSSFWGLCLFV